MKIGELKNFIFLFGALILLVSCDRGNTDSRTSLIRILDKGLGYRYYESKFSFAIGDVFEFYAADDSGNVFRLFNAWSKSTSNPIYVNFIIGENDKVIYDGLGGNQYKLGWLSFRDWTSDGKVNFVSEVPRFDKGGCAYQVKIFGVSDNSVDEIFSYDVNFGLVDYTRCYQTRIIWEGGTAKISLVNITHGKREIIYKER